MSKENKGRKGDKNKSTEKAFYQLLRAISCGIIVCFLVSVIFFMSNQISLSRSFSKISQLAAQQNTVATPYETTEPESGCSCTGNFQKSKNSDNTLVEYIEKLLSMQKETSVNEITSLVYSVIITILSIIGAGLVEKIFKSSEEAKKNVEEANEKYKASIKSYEEYLESQKLFLDVQQIHDDILYARNALAAVDKEEANDRFCELKKDVSNFIEKNKSFFMVDQDCLKRICDELSNLSSCIEKFKDRAKHIYATRPVLISSFNIAADNYNNLLNETINCCDKILEESAAFSA